MVDIPQVPPAYEQVLTQKLLRCGLRNGGFTVKYEDELQSVLIVVGKDANASSAHIDCIRRAAEDELVTFEDPVLQQNYQDRVFDVVKPKMLADAEVELKKHGALKGFPERSKFTSDKLFAEALERHCGMKPGSYFVESEWGLIGQPDQGAGSKANEDRMSCLMAAIMYVYAKGENFKFSLIGNEAFAPEK